MTREEIIQNLKYEMKKHENDKLFTFDTNISAMCKDILNYLEQEHVFNDWINVEDKVPDRYTEVLCSDIYENMYISDIFADESSITGFSCYDYDGTTDCIAWVPLPPRYKTPYKVKLVSNKVIKEE